MNVDILDLFSLHLGTSPFATQLCPNFNLSYGAIHSNSLYTLCVVCFGSLNLVFTPGFAPKSAYKHPHKRTMWVKVLALLHRQSIPLVNLQKMPLTARANKLLINSKPLRLGELFKGDTSKYR